MDKITAFRDQYLSEKIGKSLLILDLGSYDINGSYRALFADPSWRYLGLDMEAGNNVDVVLSTPYAWKQVGSNSADVVISGQVFEHIEYVWISMLEIARVLKPGGICCVVAPSSGPEHRFPMDCWRFYPDGMNALAKFAQLEVIDSQTQWVDQGYNDGSDDWHDSMLVCRKPDLGRWKNKKNGLKRWLQHRANTIGMR